MGKGAYLCIVNQTPCNFVLRENKNEGMSDWNKFPQTISAYTSEKIYFEFSGNIFQLNSSKVKGFVSYIIENTNNYFDILAVTSPDYQISVSWRQMNRAEFIVFPPPTQSEVRGVVGWSHNGTISIVVVSRLENMKKKESFYTTTSIWKNDYQKSWMNEYLEALGPLQLIEITFPGTHTSGCVKMKRKISKPWAATQKKSIYQQLENGIRCLDLTLGFDENITNDKRFMIVQEEWLTTSTMNDVLNQVRMFSAKYPNEIIIVDFHRFINFTGQIDKEELASKIKQIIGDQRLIPFTMKSSSYAHILNSISGRIVVAINKLGYISDEFWPGVEQNWFGETKKKNLLKKMIEKFNILPQFPGLWSINAILTPTAIKRIKPLTPHIDNWFYAGNEWAQRSNIIYVDFYHKTNIVDAAIGSSVMKGFKKSLKHQSMKLLEAPKLEDHNFNDDEEEEENHQGKIFYKSNVIDDQYEESKE